MAASNYWSDVRVLSVRYDRSSHRSRRASGPAQRAQTHRDRQKVQLVRTSDRGDFVLAIEPRNGFREAMISLRAPEWFSRGDDQLKRLILGTTGSNLTLQAKKLSIEGVKPFSVAAQSARETRRLATVDDYRTSPRHAALFRRWLKEFQRSLETPDGERIAHNIKLLREQFEPEALAKRKRRQGRGATEPGIT
jgi:hypothetical protein